jgi:hypothetical protein
VQIHVFHLSQTISGRSGSVNCPVLVRIAYKKFEKGTIKPVPLSSAPLSPMTRTQPPKPATRTRPDKPVKPGPHTCAHSNPIRATRTPYRRSPGMAHPDLPLAHISRLVSVVSVGVQYGSDRDFLTLDRSNLSRPIRDPRSPLPRAHP